jgi:hypothetical protein
MSLTLRYNCADVKTTKADPHIVLPKSWEDGMVKVHEWVR